MKTDELIEHHTQHITDANENEWKVIEVSDLPEIIKHYAKEVVNSITDKEIDGTFSTDHYYTNKGAKWFKQQLLKRIEDGK